MQVRQKMIRLSKIEENRPKMLNWHREGHKVPSADDRYSSLIREVEDIRTIKV